MASHNITIKPTYALCYLAREISASEFSLQFPFVETVGPREMLVNSTMRNKRPKTHWVQQERWPGQSAKLRITCHHWKLTRVLFSKPKNTGNDKIVRKNRTGSQCIESNLSLKAIIGPPATEHVKDESSPVKEKTFK